MYTDKKTQNVIHAELNSSVSHGTMRCQDLIPVFMDIIKETPEYVQLMHLVPSYAYEDKDSEWWDSEDATNLLESLFNTLNSYAPEDYYFGSHPGDGSDYGYWETERMALMNSILSVIRENGWNVRTADMENECIQFEFSRFTPAGQDFNFSAEMTGDNPETLSESIKEYYEGFDTDTEAYLWIGEDGHGKNGAPYHIKNIVDDMEAAEEMIYQLYEAMNKAF